MSYVAMPSTESTSARDGSSRVPLPSERRRYVRPSTRTLIGQLPAEAAKGPSITRPSRLRPVPPRKSGAHRVERGDRSVLQSQYGRATEASTDCSARSNSSRNLRCQGRKEGERWPVRSPLSVSPRMNALCVVTKASYRPLRFSWRSASVKRRFSSAVRFAWFLRTVMCGTPRGADGAGSLLRHGHGHAEGDERCPLEFHDRGAGGGARGGHRVVVADDADPAAVGVLHHVQLDPVDEHGVPGAVFVMVTTAGGAARDATTPVHLV